MAQVTPKAAQILALLSVIETHAREARQAAAASVLLVPKAGKPTLALATPADSMRLANGHAVAAPHSDQAGQQLAQAAVMERVHVGALLQAVGEFQALIAPTEKSE